LGPLVLKISKHRIRGENRPILSSSDCYHDLPSLSDVRGGESLPKADCRREDSGTREKEVCAMHVVDVVELRAAELARPPGEAPLSAGSKLGGYRLLQKRIVEYLPTEK
jgi:hypothetical protein